MSVPVCVIRQGDGKDTYILHNNTSRPFREGYYLAWFLELGGLVIDKGILEPNAPAGGECTFSFSHELPETGMVTVLFSAVSREDSELSPREREYAFAQFVLLDVPGEFLFPPCEMPLKGEETPSVFAVHGEPFALALDRAHLLPLQIVSHGQSLLTAPASAEAGAPLRAFRPRLHSDRKSVTVDGLYAALDAADQPVAAGAISWTVHGDGAVLLSVAPDRDGAPLRLRLPVTPALDYVEYFGGKRFVSTDGAQSDYLLANAEGLRSAEGGEHPGVRSFALSSGEITLQILPEKPITALLAEDLTLVIEGENRILFACTAERED